MNCYCLVEKGESDEGDLGGKESKAAEGVGRIKVKERIYDGRIKEEGKGGQGKYRTNEKIGPRD